MNPNRYRCYFSLWVLQKARPESKLASNFSDPDQMQKEVDGSIIVPREAEFFCLMIEYLQYGFNQTIRDLMDSDDAYRKGRFEDELTYWEIEFIKD